MSKHRKPSNRRVAKAAGAALIASGLVLGAPAPVAIADSNPVSTATSALATTAAKATKAALLAAQQANKAAAVSAGTALKATGATLNGILRGLLGKK
jgi:hypothetical protein